MNKEKNKERKEFKERIEYILPYQMCLLLTTPAQLLLFTSFNKTNDTFRNIFS